MRKAFLYLLLLGIIIGTAPYFAGQLAETKFQDVAMVFSDAESMPLTLTVLEYQRGWRKSYAKTKATLFANNPTGKSFSFYLEHEIRHGPIVQLHEGNYRNWRFARAIIDSKLLLSEEAKKILISEIGDSNLLHVNSEFTLDGAVNIQMIGKPLRLKEQTQPERVAWKGLRGEWHLTRDLKHLTGEIFLPGFDFAVKDIHYFGEDFNYKTEIAKNSQGLWPGKFVTTFRTLQIDNAAKHLLVAVQGVTTGGIIEVEKNLAEFSGSLHLEKLQVNQEMYGPINYVTSFKNINARTFKLLFNSLQKINFNANEQANNLQVLFSLLPELLKTRPEFAIDQLHIQTKQGEVKGFFKIAMGGPQASDINQIAQVFKSIAATGSMLVTKEALKEALRMQFRKQAEKIAIPSSTAPGLNSTTPLSSASVNAPSSMSDNATPTELTNVPPIEQQANEMLAKWLQQGLIVEKDKYYLIQFDLNEGKFKLNGKNWEFAKKK